jgi:PAS domain-containing protein
MRETSLPLRLADPTPAAGPAGVAPSGWRRTRLAVYLAFACIAANAGLQAWQSQRLADDRLHDAAVVDAAGRLNTLTERLGRLAALVAASASGSPSDVNRPAAELGEELARSRDEALRLQQLSTLDLAQAARTDEAAGSALERWQDARERLWYRAENLLAHLDAGRLEALNDASSAVQLEADRAARAARLLVAELQARSRELQAQGVQTAQVGAVVTVGLLLLLALGVVAPALRALQGQAARLAQQAGENERLALVAEHTGNLVIITDRERRLVWANEAFTRLTGYELHEVLGRKPGELLQSELTDPATIARMRRTAGRPRGAGGAAEPVARRARLLDRRRHPAAARRARCVERLHRGGDRDHRTGDAAPAQCRAAGGAADRGGGARPGRPRAGRQPRGPRPAGRAAG